MKIRTLILAGFASALCLAAPAHAEFDNSHLITGSKPRVVAPAKEPAADKKAGRQAKADDKTPVKPSRPAKAAAEDKAKVEQVAAVPVELRSHNQPAPGLFSTLFGGQQQMLPETQRRDALLRERDTRSGKKFQVKEDFVPRVVDYQSAYSRGTIVVDTTEKRLYLIEGAGKARRYAIAVGRDGLKFKGKGTIKDKQEWPRWIPTQDMQKREPAKYGRYKDGMPGGPDNPLGARAMYLYQGNKDTYIRVHGTNQPWTIGTDSSNGCFRMVNEHVMDLYNRVRVGAEMVVL